jgi:putative ABC transport system substrate-binding protein
MKRSQFITLLGSLLLMNWPLPTKTQRSGKIYKIGFITAGRIRPEKNVFLEELHKLGWIEGKNFVYEARYADDRLDRLPELISDLLNRDVDVIIADGTLAPLAAKRATTTIPIVMTTAGDPLGTGLVASLAKPGGNVTGMSLMAPELAGKRLQLLREFLPIASHIAVLWNAANPYSTLVFSQTSQAAQVMALEIQSAEVRNPDDFQRAFDDVTRRNADALIVVEDPLTGGQFSKIAAFAKKNRLPTLGGLRQFTDVGGLLAYGANIFDLERRAAGYVDRILKGAKPADMPVQQPTKFELVINLKTANALGVELPPLLLARADEVIE